MNWSFDNITDVFNDVQNERQLMMMMMRMNFTIQAVAKICIASVGLTFAVITFSLMRRDRAFNKSSLGQWLLLLSVADSYVLFGGLVTSIEFIMMSNQMPALIQSDIYCNLTEYFTYVMSCISSWTIMCIAIERAYVICFPLALHISIQGTRYRQIIICIVALIFNIYPMWVIEGEKMEGSFRWCRSPMLAPDSALYRIVEVMTYIDTVLTFLLPWALVIVSGIITIVSVGRQEKIATRLIASTQHNNKHQESVAKMIFVLIIVDLVLNAPSYVERFTAFFLGIQYPIIIVQHQTEINQYGKTISHILFFTHFTANFILYSTVSMFRRVKRKRYQQTQFYSTQKENHLTKLLSNTSLAYLNFLSSNGANVTSLCCSSKFNDRNSKKAKAADFPFALKRNAIKIDKELRYADRWPGFEMSEKKNKNNNNSSKKIMKRQSMPTCSKSMANNSKGILTTPDMELITTTCLTEPDVDTQQSNEESGFN